MSYPRDPIGLRWDDHYTMANQVFYAFHSNRAPSSRVQPEEPVTGGVKRPKRGYASKYVGVIKMKGKFYAVWGKGKDGQKGGFPLTEEGAEAAAWVRARALGRDWLEDR